MRSLKLLLLLLLLLSHQLCLTLCDPIDGSPPGSPFPGFSRKEHWSGLPFPSPKHKSEKWKWSRSVVPWTTACQASLSITNSWSLLKLLSIESVMIFNHLILCCPLLLPPSIFPSIRAFSNESVLHIRWPKYWCLSFSISPPSEYSELISFPGWLVWSLQPPPLIH